MSDLTGEETSRSLEGVVWSRSPDVFERFEEMEIWLKESTIWLKNCMRPSAHMNVDLVTSDARRALLIGRNLCRGVEDVIPFFLREREQSYMHQFALFVRWLGSSAMSNSVITELLPEETASSSVEFSLSDEQRHSLVLPAAQFLANFTATSAIACDWIYFSEDTSSKELPLSSSPGNRLNVLLDLLAATMKIRSRPATAAAWNALYNTVVSTKDGFDRRLNVLLHRGDVLRQFALSVHNSSTSTSNDETDPVTEWMQIFVTEMRKQEQLAEIFSVLRPKTSLSFGGNAEQLVWLHVVNHVLDEVISEEEDLPLDADICKLGNQVSTILNQLPRNTVFWNEVLAFENAESLSSKDEADTSLDIGDRMERRIRHDVNRDFLLVGLSLISSITARLPRVHALRAQIASQGGSLVDLCCQLLMHCDPTSRARRVREDPTFWFSDYRKEAVQCALQALSNLVYGTESVQNELVDDGGIHVVLNHCVTDFENPLAREWGLMTVRNACEGNEKVQAYVDTLKPQGAVIEDPKLREAGLQVEIDSTTGKFKFTQNETPPV